MIREGAEFRELMLQVFRTRMAFRRSMQRTLRKNNAGITFEMLQVLSCLWHEQGISQQILAERIAKDKACLTNLMNNLEKKGELFYAGIFTNWKSAVRSCGNRNDRICQQVDYTEPLQKIIKRN